MFGVCLLLLGVIIAWRAVFPDAPQPDNVRWHLTPHTAPLTRCCQMRRSSLSTAGAPRNPIDRTPLSRDAAQIILSGGFCWTLETEWVHTLSPNQKIPMYVVLGAGLAYSICFSLGDMLNQVTLWAVLDKPGNNPLVIHRGPASYLYAQG